MMCKYLRPIFIVIAFTMLISIVSACNIHWFGVPEYPTVKNKSEPVPEPVEPERPANNAYNFEPFVPYDETIVITVGRYFGNHHDSFDTFVHGQRNAYIDILYDELNIRVEVIFNVPFEDYEETLARHRAAGTLPDTFIIPNTYEGLVFFNELLEKNELADLTRAMNNSVGGMSKEVLDRWDFEQLFQYVTDDGKIYGIPIVNETSDISFMWARKDWFDRVERELPKTLEGMENAALAFLRAYLGRSTTAGITFIPDEIFKHQHGLLPVFAAFGAYPSNWINVNGRAEWGGIQPEVKDALALLQDWTGRNIIRPEMLSMSRDRIIKTYITTGRNGMFFSDFEHPGFIFNEIGEAFHEFDENIVWVPVMSPVNVEGQFKPMRESVLPGGQVVLATHSNPEAVVKAVNLIDEVYYGENPEFKNLRDRVLLYQDTPQGIMPFNSFIPLSDFTYEEVLPAFSGTTPLWEVYRENLMDYQTDVFIQIISGRLPLEAFDDFVVEWLQEGGAEITDEVNKLLRK